MSQRKARVEHALRDVLTELIASEVRDPRVKAATLLTVTKVELNVDLSVANVYVSIIGDDDAIADAAIAGLGKAAGFLRGPVGRKLRCSTRRSCDSTPTSRSMSAPKLAAILRETRRRPVRSVACRASHRHRRTTW